MAHRQWTKAQSDAITARGGTILVSAAAGSGKTAVLVERAISLICDEKKPVDTDKLLIVTFSNAAAAEMRQRMSLRLSEMIRENPSDLYLQRQQALLGAAHISTIHSFCLDLLRSNFQNLDISPDFSIADENELALIKNDCAAKSIEKFYQADDDGAFSELVELLLVGRDDTRLIETMLKIYDFSRSHPFFEVWLDTKLAMYDARSLVEETVWGNSILRYAADSLKFCLKSALSALELISDDEKIEKAYGSAFRSDIYQLEGCYNAAAAGNWDKTVRQLASFGFERLGQLRGDDPVKQRVKDVRSRNKDIVSGLAKKYVNATAADFKSDIADLQPKIATLFALVKDFAKGFAEAKAEKRRLDFSDFEHLALTLLVRKKDGGYERTEQALEIASRFEHVLVDEYQDSNEVQDLIFSSVSRNQENLFMVGDVKQSIYAFRQAMPEIFMKKRHDFSPYDLGEFPAKINLDMNFRSRGEVTGAVNFLFTLLMSDTIGDVDYGDEENLKCGAVYQEYGRANPALLLISTENYDGEKDTVSLEAAEIANQICEMLESGYSVSSENGPRPAMPRDFCVLLRAPKNRADIYVRELAARGIPAWAESSGGYLKSQEVSSIICLLKAVDNPLLDIELAAAMMSPFFDFNADDMARIRIKARNAPFYTALCAAAEDDEKTAAFLKLFRELRAMSAIMPADRLIMRLYELIDALPIARAMNMGETRAANLQLLIEYAAEYHSLGYKQLSGFVGFISRLQDKKRDLLPSGIIGDGANVVRIMSVHHSKGLEFPVVILVDSAKAFNKMDLRAATMLHSKYGFACVRRDHKLFKQFPTVPMQSIRLESEKSMLSEELRILYVALTRAREKLIISAVCKSNLQKKLNGLRCELENGRLPPYVVGEANSYADWILMALLHHKSANALRAAANMDDLELIDDGIRWDIILSEPVGHGDGIVRIDPEPTARSNKALLDELKRRVSYVYPFDERTKIPAKLAISAVSGREAALKYRFASRPEFMREHAMTAAEKGNAMHKFMQFANYEAARDDLDSEIARMKNERFLSATETESLSKPKLMKFFRSNLAKRIFKSEKVYRELKFMSECGHDVLGGLISQLNGQDNAKIVLQGVADCVFIEKSGAVIVDYKTDYVTDENELISRYSNQLSLYRAILSKSLDVPIKACVLYSFALSKEIIVCSTPLLKT